MAGSSFAKKMKLLCKLLWGWGNSPKADCRYSYNSSTQSHCNGKDFISILFGLGIYKGRKLIIKRSGINGKATGCHAQNPATIFWLGKRQLHWFYATTKSSYWKLDRLLSRTSLATPVKLAPKEVDPLIKQRCYCSTWNTFLKIQTTTVSSSRWSVGRQCQSWFISKPIYLWSCNLLWWPSRHCIHLHVWRV